ncbi:MAG: YraN family protein [Acidobacteriaceae bacterium]
MARHSLPLRLEQRAYTALRSWADRKHLKPQHLLTGERGEVAAYYHLRELGYTVVARRWQAERVRGDLDLVAWDGDTLVIFEIKTRTARDFAPAQISVDHHKERTLCKLALAYLRQFPGSVRWSVPLRFDILSVYLLAGGTEFEHIRSAFPFTDRGRS